jgi:hypothetical protein
MTPTPRRRSKARALGLGVAVAAALVGVHRWNGTHRDVTAMTASMGRTSATAMAPPPATSSTATQPTSGEGVARSEKSDIPATMALLITANAPLGRRVFVRGHVVGETPHALLVTCGTAPLKVGSRGSTRTVDIPCGQEISLENL